MLNVAVIDRVWREVRLVVEGSRRREIWFGFWFDVSREMESAEMETG